MTDDKKKARIAALNDELRIAGRSRNGKVIITGDLVNEVDDGLKMALVIAALQSFNNFNPDNDPHGEHDCGTFETAGERFMFKIDYYALDEESLSEHPEDPNVTIRVLSVFYAHDY
ncbi:Protein of unknown function [Rhizobium sp. AN5]|uniref:DUF3768 domain-containing protein n=1 Tax=Rhizobium sp. AN5 TaxID=1855304 RepID=UPI000BDD7F4C|nr:DUF3768 domain-containing protein [Rhizobium sp. AN5]SOC90053.1 Protein of unknown function [Rhizobium sp. AN5]